MKGERWVWSWFVLLAVTAAWLFEGWWLAVAVLAVATAASLVFALFVRRRSAELVDQIGDGVDDP
jgi:hypothetical protein